MWIMEIHHSGTKRCWNGSGQENDRLGETSPTFKRVKSSTRLLRFALRVLNPMLDDEPAIPPSKLRSY
jgi:hypothetical protein